VRFIIRSTTARVLIYSHDSFGLGHIRRCRTIAHALAEAIPKLRVLIVSGSPIIGSFEFKARVDFIRIPGIIKLRSGDYVPLGGLGSIEATTALRSSLIRETAMRFAPDLLIVDKEPLGLRGELEATLPEVKARGTRLILGLRDVLDEPRALAAEWDRKRARPAVEALYDDILVYGLREIHDPLSGLGLSSAVAARTRHTGYLKRARPASGPSMPVPDIQDRILVTAGGGGDGETLIDWVVSTYEAAGGRLPPALIVPGPFMAAETRQGFERRIAALPALRCVTFEPRMEQLVADARAVLCMGGYNTFCEILSFDKRSALVPRQVPRCEQTIRAQAADRLGLARWVPEGPPGVPPDLGLMERVILGLEQQPRPSVHAPVGLLDGLSNVVAHCGAALGLSSVGL
jgi:predicted glycosyltransferase